MNSDQGYTIETVLDFRKPFARVCASGLIKDWWDTGFATFRCEEKDNMAVRFNLFDVRAVNDVPEDCMRRLPAHVDAVIIAITQTEYHEPRLVDLLRLGVLERTRYHGIRIADNVIEILDFIVTAPDGSFKSVLEATGLGESLWCDRCKSYIFGGERCPGVPVDLEIESLYHRQGCPWIAQNMEHGAVDDAALRKSSV